MTCLDNSVLEPESTSAVKVIALGILEIECIAIHQVENVTGSFFLEHDQAFFLKKKKEETLISRSLKTSYQGRLEHFLGLAQ